MIIRPSYWTAAPINMSCDVLSASDRLPLATGVYLDQSLEAWDTNVTAKSSDRSDHIQVQFIMRRAKVLQAMAVIMFIGAVRGLTHILIPDFCLPSCMAFDL